MNELTVEQFSEFFEALWKWPPFAWQRDLAARALENFENPWPEAIALPTASGKTACIDIAVFAMAAKARKDGDFWFTDAPRRIFFVVDRRVIVDEAFERARKIARKLRSAEDGILHEVAERLRRLAGSNIPLMVFQLRGGMYRSDAWSRSPIQPAVVATTVDQIGSRLLFRAYGRSPKAWPIQAGLAGNDALVLLDEAHCSQPFMETLRSVKKYRQWAEIPLASPFHVSIMSATPPDTEDVFSDESEEPKTKGHPLGDRRLASKKTKLVPTKANGKNAIGIMAEELAKTAEELAGGKPLAVVVFANYVSTAREVWRILEKKHGQNTILLTGRMRPIDKDDVVSESLRKFGLSSGAAKDRRLEAPVFVVATQTLEVGADLDFDALATECAALDSLRQRFGRLNRMGREIDARAAILMREDYVKSSEKDPVYGEALGMTWHWLLKQADENGQVDMGIAALSERLPSGEELALLSAPSEHAPVMLPSHVDCWVQTMPEPFPTPDPSVFLRGPGRASADVQVCWRADIDLSTENSVASLDALSLCPPSAAESLAVPLWVFKKWMDSEETRLDAVSDVESAPEQSNEERGEKGGERIRRVVRWRGREEVEVVFGSRKIRPGDVIVVPSGETDWDVLGDLPGSVENPPVDWGDRAHAKARGKAILRLHPEVVKQWPENHCKDRFVELAEKAGTLFDEDPDDFIVSLKKALADLEKIDGLPWLSGIAAELGKIDSNKLKRFVISHPSGKGVVVKGREQIDPQAVEFADEIPDWFSDEDDAASSGTAYIHLKDHLDGVSLLARRFASGCGLPGNMADSMATAGFFHDTGKADRRFQALLRGGNAWTGGELLAKSEDIPQGRSAYLRARKAAGYPEGGRHEMLSVRLAESAPEAAWKNEESAENKELVLHLIESHHGHCRPFAPVVFDMEPIEVSVDLNGFRLSARSETNLERLDSGVPERFWRLVRRYGWWGLAWLESIFRLADHRRSEQEEKEGGNAR